MDTAAAKKRCEAASKGPWASEGPGGWVSGPIPGGRPNGEIIGRFRLERTGLHYEQDDQANADFAAHARTDLPAALEALEEAQRKNERLKAALEKANRQHNWETHGYYEGSEADCLDCQRHADVL